MAWGIITNKPLRFTKPLLERLAIHPTRGVAICPDHVSRTKPDPEPLLLAATQLDIDPARCIYAGDHLREVDLDLSPDGATVVTGWRREDEITRPCVDLVAIDRIPGLGAVTVTADGITLGATVSHHTIESHPLLAASYSALGDLGLRQNNKK